MTGQVKEDILVNAIRMGVKVRGATLGFNPFLLKKEYFARESETVEWISVEHQKNEQGLPPDALAFTCCQVPVVYKRGTERGLTVHFKDGTSKQRECLNLDKETSAEVFKRTGKVRHITVSLTDDHLRNANTGNS